MENSHFDGTIQKALIELDNPEFQSIKDPPLRAIKTVQFGILSAEEIKLMAVCEIKHSRITHPPSGTVYDERMGPSSSRGICQTCLEDIRICPGHFGYIDLAVPIVHPMYIKYIVAILNCVCLKCSKLKMSIDEIELELNTFLEHDRYIRRADRLSLIVKKCCNVAYCNDCNYPHPDVKEIDGCIYKIYEAIGKKTKKKSLIEIDELSNIFMKIPAQDIKLMGFNPSTRGDSTTFRPEWLILTRLPVIPPMSRPPNNDGEMKCDDDLTTSYTDIIKYNERLKDPNIKEKLKTELISILQKHITGLFDNSNGFVARSNGKIAKGIKERICGKQGHIRGRLMGKRVDCSARTVITADPNIRLNEVGVPEIIAKALSFPEKVIPRNIAEMTKLLDEGKINTLVRGNQNIRVAFAQQAGRKIKLQCGDIVYRHLKDGDTVVFNRQPTLHRGSMMAHYVKILPGKTFRLNLSVCTPYNADFDGKNLLF